MSSGLFLFFLVLWTHPNSEKKIQIIQNKMARFVLSKDSRDHIGQQELDIIGTLNVSDRVKQLKMNHVFKIFNNTAPADMHLNFKRLNEQHGFNTRGHSYNFFIPMVSSSTRDSFYFTALQEWNNLPSNIKSLTNLSVFKKEVKHFMSQRAKEV